MKEETTTVCVRHALASRFLKKCGHMLMRDEARQNLMLGVSMSLGHITQPNPAHHFLTAEYRGKVAAASVNTFGKALLWQQGGEAHFMKPLADYYLQHSEALHSILALEAHSENFARHYPHEALQVRKLQLNVLRQLNPLSESAGEMVLAKAAHTTLIAQWIAAFYEVSGMRPLPSAEQMHHEAASRIEQGSFYLWQIADEPVSMACVMRQTVHVATLGLVYTPAALRGRGFAISLVSRLTALLLGRGFTCIALFTELTNPWVNTIYRNVGYRQADFFLDLTYAGE